MQRALRDVLRIRDAGVLDAALERAGDRNVTIEARVAAFRVLVESRGSGRE